MTCGRMTSSSVSALFRTWTSTDAEAVSSDKQHKWEQIQYNSAAPPRRTGHILVSSSGKLYLCVQPIQSWRDSN